MELSGFPGYDQVDAGARRVPRGRLLVASGIWWSGRGPARARGRGGCADSSHLCRRRGAWVRVSDVGRALRRRRERRGAVVGGRWGGKVAASVLPAVGAPGPGGGRRGV